MTASPQQVNGCSRIVRFGALIVTGVLPLFGVTLILVADAPASAASSWTPITAPGPSGGSGIILNGVSCPVPGWCLAAGGTLLEEISGTAVSATTIPTSSLDPPPQSGTGLAVGAAACSSISECAAVGTYAVGSGQQDVDGVLVSVDGSSVSAVTAPLSGLSPPPYSSPGVRLSSVSCPAAGWCVTVGAYLQSTGADQPLIETLASGRWSPSTVDLSSLSPPPATTASAGKSQEVLEAVSCWAAAACTAVGTYGTAAGSNSFIATLSGGNWTVSSGPSVDASFDASFFSCPSPTSCVAISSQGGSALVQTSSGWTTSQLPPNVMAVEGFSCPAAGWCVAVGSTSSQGQVGTFVDTFSNRSWSATTLPSAGLNPPAATTQNPYEVAFAIACPTLGQCQAAGTYRDNSGASWPFAAELSGGSWSVSTPSLSGMQRPANGNPGVTVTGESCASENSCAIVGWYWSQGQIQGLIEVSGSGAASQPGGPSPTGSAGPSTPSGMGMAATPDGKGYWLVASDGGIFTYGDAGFFGSAGAIHLAKPIVGMASTPDGKGYWLVASDGGIFTYGDAGFYGSAGAIHLAKPIVGMASTPDGKGYWLVASDGGIFTYGDAGFFGSAGAIHLAKPIVGMAATPDGKGYWLVASDGGIFTYGDAGFFGSAGAIHLAKPIVGMAATPDGKGYWLVASDGGIFTYGDAGFFGSET